MITVIPVYTDPDTGETLHLKDKPELVDLLRSMQDDGANNYYAWLYSPIL